MTKKRATTGGSSRKRSTTRSGGRTAKKAAAKKSAPNKTAKKASAASKTSGRASKAAAGGAERSAQYSVVVADDHLQRVPEVVKRLRSAGMRVDQVHESLGTVTGSMPPSTRGAVEKLPGVAVVQESQDYQLPPFDSGTPQ